MLNPKTVYFVFCLFLFQSGFSQFFKEKQALIRELSAAKKDTQKIAVLISLAELTESQNFIESYNYAKQAADLSEKINYTMGRIKAYNALGDATWYHTDYAKAQDFYFKAYKLNDSLKDELQIANSLYNIGWVVCIQQHNDKEIGYLYKALHIFRTRKDTGGIMKLYNAFGNYFTNRYGLTKAKPYFDSALVYFNSATALCQSSQMLFDEHALLYGNMGDLLALSGDYKSAIFYCEKAEKAFNNDGDSMAYYMNLANLGSYYRHLGDVNRSLDLLEKVLRFCNRTDNRQIEIVTYGYLYKSYVQKNDAARALQFLEKYTMLNDTMNRQIFSTSLKDRQNSFEIEKKEADIKELKQTNEIHKLQEEKNTFFLIATGCVALIVLSVAYFLYRQNKEKSLANRRLSEQNTIITQKKQEIDKSINYAKGIQNAVL
ncbi:MAG: hypothetical protein ACXVP0_08945, partial [Bacteroidia bacterium]